MGWQLSSTTVVVLASFHSRLSKVSVHRGCGTAHRNVEIETESSVRGGPALFIAKLMMTYAAFIPYFTRPKHQSSEKCIYFQTQLFVPSLKLLFLHINQPAYFTERNMEYIIYISRTTQRTNTGQVPACSQEPVDSTDANIVETSTCLKTIR